jgi:hypothetical protein
MCVYARAQTRVYIHICMYVLCTYVCVSTSGAQDLYDVAGIALERAPRPSAVRARELEALFAWMVAWRYCQVKYLILSSVGKNTSSGKVSVLMHLSCKAQQSTDF